MILLNNSDILSNLNFTTIFLFPGGQTAGRIGSAEHQKFGVS